ncbi:MAG: RNA pyrophosphohydrolase [Gammaproteobacteria bacterium]|nr:RNA pyrophosphohydrolase [Gammaproteobacteria bacterium]MCH9743934.1 RNA pyrophosphohydrolase [Gammaproteobacteria bacterium]
MIDSEGYRANIGIVVCNDKKQVLWCRRLGNQDAWQFPQGGMKKGESDEQSMHRELKEELGLDETHIQILGKTKDWLKYALPERFQRRDQKPLCIGQKQKWFLLRLVADTSLIRFDQSEQPEFDEWRWVDYWYPVKHVIPFKKDVYQQALEALKAFL